jgi:hypothetical protein
LCNVLSATSFSPGHERVMVCKVPDEMLSVDIFAFLLCHEGHESALAPF